MPLIPILTESNTQSNTRKTAQNAAVSDGVEGQPRSVSDALAVDVGVPSASNVLVPSLTQAVDNKDASDDDEEDSDESGSEESENEPSEPEWDGGMPRAKLTEPMSVQRSSKSKSDQAKADERTKAKSKDAGSNSKAPDSRKVNPPSTGKK